MKSFFKRKKDIGRPPKYWPERSQPFRKDERNPIADLLYNWDGPRLHKWEHYSRHYHHHFQPFIDRPSLRVLEIGVYGGGSLELWRKYFGPQAQICGLDINPECAKLNLSPDLSVIIGSQDDPETLQRAFDALGAPPDLVIDDGSHFSHHVRSSFQWIWPRLLPGSLYVVEDLHASYWKDFGGGYQQPFTSIGLIQDLIDDLHEPHHTSGHKHAKGLEIGGLHVYDSMVFIEKTKRPEPRTWIQPPDEA